MDKIFEQIFDYVLKLEIIDTHEHLAGSEGERDFNTDVLKEYTSHYFGHDLISAGLSITDYHKVMDIRLPLMERWILVECYWNAAIHTGYGRQISITARDLYGVDKISGATLEELNEKFLKSLALGQYDLILKKKSNIKTALLDSGDLNCDRKFFSPVFRLDNFICPTSRGVIEQNEIASGIRITSFDDWLEACECMLEKAIAAGAAALKTGLAYDRTLFYERASRSEAEVEFNALFKNNHIPAWEQQIMLFGKKMQDYMMHFILRSANKKNLTYQVHTGLHAGNGNRISNSDPTLLSNLFLDYPDVDFDIFHIGYPYEHTLSVLSKTFPNVYIDMCWAHVISPVACVNALVEWLDSVPVNKISAFGGDSCIIDVVYGHQYMARENVSKALAIKVSEGYMDIERAKQIAQMLFYSNPVRIFKLETIK